MNTQMLFVLSGIFLLNLAILSGINGVWWGLALGGSIIFNLIGVVLLMRYINEKRHT
ncbi:hypothetical protein [Bacillus paralicheniformis]|uniref:Uncharacterized protein n=1 Tax=Bacillus paralicheniformis TaxID=1648923 RepID=A0A7Z1B3Q3_9BACI|nr:hypothetical protein [Bacillus paralicheniformis]KFM90157.1 putative membrane protein [Bacillus paralicheniformis]MBU8700204.1 hypothetical protein [Bacillus paralicheniformis]MBX9435152.1 hypothetical protein [Bacillus paralicheniformis]MDU0414044.1 hypothetical protein [Bacillus paralicheniformis]MEC2169931.1 hypothetical protein [Bacillus paralicheniformis]